MVRAYKFALYNTPLEHGELERLRHDARMPESERDFWKRSLSRQELTALLPGLLGRPTFYEHLDNSGIRYDPMKPIFDKRGIKRNSWGYIAKATQNEQGSVFIFVVPHANAEGTSAIETLLTNGAQGISLQHLRSFEKSKNMVFAREASLCKQGKRPGTWFLGAVELDYSEVFPSPGPVASSGPSSNWEAEQVGLNHLHYITEAASMTPESIVVYLLNDLIAISCSSSSSSSTTTTSPSEVCSAASSFSFQDHPNHHHHAVKKNKTNGGKRDTFCFYSKQLRHRSMIAPQQQTPAAAAAVAQPLVAPAPAAEPMVLAAASTAPAPALAAAPLALAPAPLTATSMMMMSAALPSAASNALQGLNYIMESASMPPEHKTLFQNYMKTLVAERNAESAAKGALLAENFGMAKAKEDAFMIDLIRYFSNALPLESQEEMMQGLETLQSDKRDTLFTVNDVASVMHRHLQDANTTIAVKRQMKERRQPGGGAAAALAPPAVAVAAPQPIAAVAAAPAPTIVMEQASQPAQAQVPYGGAPPSAAATAAPAAAPPGPDMSFSPMEVSPINKNTHPIHLTSYRSALQSRSHRPAAAAAAATSSMVQEAASVGAPASKRPRLEYAQRPYQSAPSPASAGFAQPVAAASSSSIPALPFHNHQYDSNLLAGR